MSLDNQRPFEELKDAARSFDLAHRVVPFETDEVDVEGGMLGGHPFEDVSKVASSLFLPTRYITRQENPPPKTLVQEMFRHGIAVRGLKDNARAVLTNGVLTDINWERKVALNATDLVASMERAITEAKLPVMVERHNLSRSTGDVWINCVFSDTHHEANEAQVGDVLQSGFAVLHNVAGGRTEVSGLIYRLVCTNGMVTSEKNTPWRVPSDDLDHSLPDRLMYLKDFGEDAMSTFSRTRQTALQNPTAAAISVANHLGLRKALKDTLIERVAHEEVSTLYDLLNLITNMANNVDDAEDARFLQTQAGWVVRNPSRVCDHCHQMVTH